MMMEENEKRTKSTTARAMPIRTVHRTRKCHMNFSSHHRFVPTQTLANVRGSMPNIYIEASLKRKKSPALPTVSRSHHDATKLQVLVVVRAVQPRYLRQPQNPPPDEGDPAAFDAGFVGVSVEGDVPCPVSRPNTPIAPD